MFSKYYYVNLSAILCETLANVIIIRFNLKKVLRYFLTISQLMYDKRSRERNNEFLKVLFLYAITLINFDRISFNLI